MPQRPYLPLGTLRQAILYPALELEVGDDEIAAIARRVRACGLGARLDRGGALGQILSGGERQRLAFARLFLQKPQIAILDEATSALDEDSQAVLMRLVKSELPATTVVSVGQRPEAEAFHDRCLRLVRAEGGARLVDHTAAVPLRVSA